MSIIQPITNKNLTNLSTRTKPNLTEELHRHQLQHVGNGGDIQNPAEHDRRSMPSTRSASRKRPQHPRPSRTAATQRAPPLLVTRPKQQLALPHQKTKPLGNTRTHTHDDRLVMWTFSNFNITTHPNLLNFQSKTSTSWHYIFKTFLQILASQSRMFCEP